MGWDAAARGHLGEVLPVPQRIPRARRDRIPGIGGPLALARRRLRVENSKDDDRVGVLALESPLRPAALRVVFAYRRDVAEGADLVARLTESVIGGLSIADRLAINGETSLIIGNRGGADTFPYGYFRAWTLDTNTGRFDRA